jgi:hypothetical protein
LENGINIWTAKNGSCEMNYVEFIDKIKDFIQSFFIEMDKQVESAILKDWGNIKVDKQKLLKDHEQYKNYFFANILQLEMNVNDKTEL